MPASGDPTKDTYMCILPLNIANEKIFFAFWLLFMLLFSVSILAIVNRILTVSSSSFRKIAIRKLIEMGRFRRPAQLLIEDFLGREILELKAIGDWYMLLQVGKNVDGHYFDLFVNELAKLFTTGWRLEYGDDVEANETLEQDNQGIPLIEVNSSTNQCTGENVTIIRKSIV